MIKGLKTLTISIEGRKKSEISHEFNCYDPIQAFKISYNKYSVSCVLRLEEK